MPTVHDCRPPAATKTLQVEIPEAALATLEEAARHFAVTVEALVAEAAIAHAGELAWRRDRFGLQSPYTPGPPTADLPARFRFTGGL